MHGIRLVISDRTCSVCHHRYITRVTIEPIDDRMEFSQNELQRFPTSTASIYYHDLIEDDAVQQQRVLESRVAPLRKVFPSA